MLKKLKTKKLDKKLNEFGVFDFETFIYKGKHIPYCGSYTDNTRSFTYYISKNKEIPIDVRKELFLNQFFDEIINVAAGKYVFAHNFSKFDGFYLVPYFMKKVNDKKIEAKDYNVMISTQGESKIYGIDFKNKKKTIKFRDWYLLVNESLKNLAILLNLENPDFKKTIFPYNFLKENPENLFYKGKKPEFNNFFIEEEVLINNIVKKVPINKLNLEETLQIYNTIPEENYDLQLEAENYCKNDCFLLYTIIKHFQKETAEMYKLCNSDAIFDMLTNMTTAQMAFNVYRKIFQKADLNLVIPETSKEIEFIRKGYRGAYCEVFVPETPKGWITAEFDYVSKYPEVMRNNIFPTGQGKYVKDLFFEKGKIFYFDAEQKEYFEFFGFVQGTVNVPKQLNTPYLYIHTEKRGNVAPTGLFNSVWPSEDLIYASEIGTQIVHLEDGFHYDKTSDVFSSYVDFHFPIRLANKNNPKGKLTKLMLNSLYGKTGQKLISRVSLCVNEHQFLILAQIMENIKIHVELVEAKMYYISFDKSIDLNSILNIIKDYELARLITNTYNNMAKREQQWSNNSLPHIAAFITAYARQDIHKLGMRVKHGIWNATDTDALHISFNINDPKQIAEYEYFKSLCAPYISVEKKDNIKFLCYK